MEIARTTRTARTAVLIGLGAALGASARLGVSFLIDAPSALLLSNLLGCFLMGFLRPGPFLGTGVLGGFTSFSTFMLMFAPLYAIFTVLGCVGAWLCGDALADRRKA